jgi:prevent-host-death family protein
MIHITTHEAKTHLSRLLKKVNDGEEVIIKKGDQPVARILPYRGGDVSKRPKVGKVTTDPIELSDDAFSPLTEEEMKEWGI